MNAKIASIAPRENISGDFLYDLSIALVSPNEKRRAAAAESACSFCEFSSFLANPSDQARLAQLRFDVILVDIDGDTENALKVVEALSGGDSTKVLVYSSDKNEEKLTRCIRAGARDFLAFPFQRDAIIEAFSRLSAPRAANDTPAEQPESRNSSANRGSFWRRAFHPNSIRSALRP
jgi:pilus assembly protein CpaE